ncbi:MAG: LLM class flavin-dependent oxidoreductase [Pedobacter sp.]|nr:MAG: LLM class flavin-dependent oxidoreductase [Pedobacter sp.]
MELGIGMFGDLQIDSQGKVQAPAQRLKEILEEIKLMDELGIDFFGIGEHHRPDYAVSVPEMILAAAAPITKNIKLGSAVSVLSSSDPVRLFQNFSTLDLLSEGRAEIMAGRGSFIESFPLFGFNLNDYNQLFEEKLDLLLKLNQSPKVSWSGQFRPALHNQEVYPQPYQNGLKVWIAVGGTPESVERAARLGLPIIFAIIGGSPQQFLPLFDYYKRVYLGHGHDPAKMEIAVHMHSFFGEESQAIADTYYPFYAAQMNRIGATRNWPPFSKAQFERGRAQDGALIIGDAAQSTDKILALIETFGLTRFSAHMDVGSPDHQLMMKSIEIFGDKIIPEIRKHAKEV